MKKIFLLLLISVCCKPIYAQVPHWLWAQTEIGGGCYVESKGISCSPRGSIYISGRYGGTMTLGRTTTLTTPPAIGEGSVFSAKMDSAGNFIWFAPHAATGGTDYNYGFARDNEDNTFTTGDINGIYIDKYDSNGILKWYLPALGNGAGYDIKTDNNLNVYLVGDYAGTLTINSHTISSDGGSNDMFLAKFDSNGVCKWLRSGGGSGVDGARSVALDPEGNIYVCGSYSSDATFGSVVAPNVTTGYPNLFVVKYDSSGTALRVTVATNAGFDNSYQFWRFQEVTVDSCENAYVAGSIVNTAQFGPTLSLNSLSNYNSTGDHNVFVGKIHFDGNWEWVQGGLGVGDYGSYGVALDKAGDVYATGSFENTAQFDDTSVTGATANISAAYIAKYSNSSGKLQWIQTGSGTGGWDLSEMSFDNIGNTYITGGGGSGTGIFGSHTVNGQGTCYADENALITKLGTVPPRAIIPVLAKSYCPGSTDTIPYSLIGSFNLGNTFIAEISDSNGSFITYDTLGSVISNSNGKIVITIPSNLAPGSTYLIRILSTSPTASSYAACTGDYIANVYNNSFYVTIGGNINVALSPVSPSICSGSSIQLSASGGTSYLWGNGATTDTTTVSPTQDSTFTLIVNNGGCVLDTSIYVNVSPAGTLNVQPPSQSICSGNNILLYVVNKETSYAWSPTAGLNVTTGDSVIASPTVATTYTVTAVSGGCTSTGYDTIGVVPAPNKPTITVSVTGDSLISSAGSYNQWFFNDQPTDSSRSVFVIKGHAKGWYTVTVTNPANGCSTTSDSTTGIHQLSAISDQLSIYPNPFNNNITIKINSSANNINEWYLQVIDVLGRTLYTMPSLTYSNLIDLSDLSNGVYFITVINKNDRAVFPVVKQN